MKINIFLYGWAFSWLVAVVCIGLMLFQENPDKTALKTVAAVSIMFSMFYFILFIFFTEKAVSGKKFVTLSEKMTEDES